MQLLTGGRDRKEYFLALKAEKRRREERRRQSDPNGGLLEFIRYFWHVLEPVDPFVEGWPLECLCAHLEAITRGETVAIDGEERHFNRFLANVPPGFMKSLTVNIFWPAWEWGPMEMPHLRYVAFSYASDLTERDNAKFRDLVCSDAYKEMWGHVFAVIGDPKAGKIRVTNNKTGFKFASSLGGVGTGERGHRVLCLAPEQSVLTEHGPVPIKTLVRERRTDRVWSYNSSTNKVELQPIVAWHENPGRPVARITTEAGHSITCTLDHEIYVADGSAHMACTLAVGDCLFAPRSAWLESRQREAEPLPLPASPDTIDRGEAGLKLSGKHGQVPRTLIKAHAPRNFAHMLFCYVRRAILPPAMAFAILNVLGPRAIAQVGSRCIRGMAVYVKRLLALGSRSYESLKNQVMNEAILGFAAHSQAYPRVALVQRARHDLAGQLHDMVARRTRPPFHGCKFSRASLTSNRAGQASNASKTGDLIQALRADDSAPHFDRIASIDFLHEAPQFVYCLTVAENHNLFCAVLAKNCDDLNKIKGTAESDEARLSTATWALEAMQNRLNDLRRDVIVVIQQRTHEQDVSGALMENLRDEYCHLIIPMEFEPNRHFSHYTGWNGGQDPRQYDKELAWIERYPIAVLASYKRNAYLWSGQYQQNPVPRGGGLFKEDWWQVHEVRPKETGGYTFTPAVSPLYVLASLDTAYSEKEENDPSALTVWIVHDNAITKQRNILLIDAWAKMLPNLSGPTPDPLPGESNAAYRRRCMPKWGLAEWVADTCTRRKVNMLIVENKNRAPDVIKEIKKLFADRDWGVRSIDIKGDKWGRANAITDIFTDDMVFAPAEVTEDGDVRWLEWAQEAMSQIARFPRGSNDDIVDSMTMAMKFLRDNGWAIRKDERRAYETARMTHKGESPRAERIKGILAG